MTIQLLACDLDGTLIPDLRAIPARTHRAIQQAMARGVYVVLATGREYPVTRRFVDQLGLTTPVICYQGARTVDPASGQTVDGEPLPSAAASRLVALARDGGLSLYLYLNDRAYTENPTPLSRSIFGDIGTAVEHVSSLTPVAQESPTKAIIVHPPEQAEAVARRLQVALNGQARVFRSLAPLIEVTSPRVSKGQALARLAARLGIDHQAVMAIGDQDNDVDMLAWAGLGVAMGNASPAAKAAADVIAPPISEEGAAWAIEHFILE